MLRGIRPKNAGRVSVDGLNPVANASCGCGGKPKGLDVMKSKLSAALAAACITAATPIMGLPALGAACLETPATQTLGGLVNFNLVGGGTSTTCTAGNVTFSNVVVNT